MKHKEKEFQRNPHLENLLEELSPMLRSAERQYLGENNNPFYPVIYVVGAPRVGSTLLMQWLANTNIFAYPTNFLSRFYASPYIGARLQQLLFDPHYDYRNELNCPANTRKYFSEVGKTKGALEPHEFWYFWRRFLPNEGNKPLTSKEESRIDSKGFANGLGLLQKAYQKPFVMKCHILRFNLQKLYSIYPNSLFIFLRRESIYTCQSILETRLKVYNDINTWHSAKPPEYEWLCREDPYTQIAGQVMFTEKHIKDQLKQLPSKNRIELFYENFCDNPRCFFGRVLSKLKKLNYLSDQTYTGPHNFSKTNHFRLSQNEIEKLHTALKMVS